MINAYSFGRIAIDGKEYSSDVIIFPDRIQSSWWRKKGHSLVPEDIQEIFAEKPDVLIVGTGAYGAMQVPGATAEHIRKAGIRLLVLPTEKACQEYNRLSPTQKVVAALHLTC